jgi:hypothetical protein
MSPQAYFEELLTTHFPEADASKITRTAEILTHNAQLKLEEMEPITRAFRGPTTLWRWTTPWREV